VMDTKQLIGAGESMAGNPKAAERTPLDQVAGFDVHITPLTVAPHNLGGLIQGLSTQAASHVTLHSPIDHVSAAEAAAGTANITFTWDVDRATIGDVPVTSELYVSVLPEGQGLFPDDPSRLEDEPDGNPHRILTKEDLAPNTFQFHLPAG